MEHANKEGWLCQQRGGVFAASIIQQASQHGSIDPADAETEGVKLLV